MDLQELVDNIKEEQNKSDNLCKYTDLLNALLEEEEFDTLEDAQIETFFELLEETASTLWPDLDAILKEKQRLEKIKKHYDQSAESEEDDYNENIEGELEYLTINEKLDHLSMAIPEIEEKIAEKTNPFVVLITSFIVWTYQSQYVKQRLLKNTSIWEILSTLFLKAECTRKEILILFLTIFTIETEEGIEKVVKKWKEKETINMSGCQEETQVDHFFKNNWTKLLLDNMCKSKNNKDTMFLITSALNLLLYSYPELWGIITKHQYYDNFIHSWIGHYLNESNVLRWAYLELLFTTKKDVVKDILYASDFECMVDTLLKLYVNHSETNDDLEFPIYKSTFQTILSSDLYKNHYNSCKDNVLKGMFENIHQNPVSSPRAKRDSQTLYQLIE